MEQTEMEVETTETLPASGSNSCPEAKPPVTAESSEAEHASIAESSSPIEPSSQTNPSEHAASSEVPSNVENLPQAAPSEPPPPSQEVSPDLVTPSTAISSSEMPPPPPAAPSSEVPSVAEQVSPLPGPSSEASASSAAPKLTNGPATKKQRLDYHSMSTGVYLDSTVVPILHLALVTLDRLRPADPVQYVIDFLLRHKAQYSKTKD